MSATNAACSFTKKTATVTRFRVGNLWGIEPHRFPLLSPSPPSFAVAGVPRRFRWEKAARGTDGRYFTWGNQWQDSATNWAGSGINGTNAIAAFPLSRSLYGVEDMAGNVFEYTSTLRHLGTQTLAVMKGCSWDDSPGFCRAAYQHTRPAASRHILFGFRLVRE